MVDPPLPPPPPPPAPDSSFLDSNEKLNGYSTNIFPLFDLIKYWPVLILLPAELAAAVAIDDDVTGDDEAVVDDEDAPPPPTEPPEPLGLDA